MGSEASLKDISGKEIHTGISVLSLTVSATKTILNSLNENDTISIVTYSTNSEILVEPTYVTKNAIQEIQIKLDKLKPTNTTNIWSGLKKSLDLVRLNPYNQLQCIFLLTDGVPNIEPPRGHEYELTNYFIKNPDFKCMINSYGFGYNLKSDLLQNISKISKGDGFAFIPDSILLGNIFIQGISNFMCTYDTNCIIELKLTKEYSFEDDTQVKIFTIDSLKHGKSKI